MPTYDLNIPPDTVRQRLEDAADRPTPRYWALPGTTRGRPVIGEAGLHQFWWRLRQDERATFAPWLTGEIKGRPGGSTVIVSFHSPLTRRARAVLAVVVFVLTALWVAVTPEKNLSNAFGAGLLISLVILFPLIGTWLLKGEERRLQEIFEETFAGAIETPAIRKVLPGH